MTITANDIKRLLVEKHSNKKRSMCPAGADLVVVEYKCGRSFNPDTRRQTPIMDVFAWQKHWEKPAGICYEVKISVSDFKQDIARRKWESYIPYCNYFSFVTPNGLIQPEDVPDIAGLMWVNSKGTGLITKKRPVFMEKKIPFSILDYILQYRVKIINPGLVTS